ncbi:MAG TPA: Wzz/FepE/Etk N-terminal domain-containing protein, partial [Bacteroidota bacterium]|nr:Wzz/FepE/Etk N-terminal domain-containing protein [Bacteroidota bacterium]
MPRGRHLAALELLYRWKNLLIVNVLAVSVIAAGISFMIPKTYKATASVLPPKQNDIFSSLGGVASSIVKSIPGASRLGLAQKPSGYNYFAILNSRTSLEDVVRKFNLISVYEIPDTSMERAVKELSNNVSFEEQPDDNITITVRDKNAQRAAEMAN